MSWLSGVAHKIGGGMNAINPMGGGFGSALGGMNPLHGGMGGMGGFMNPMQFLGGGMSMGGGMQQFPAANWLRYINQGPTQAADAGQQGIDWGRGFNQNTPAGWVGGQNFLNSGWGNYNNANGVSNG